MPQPHILRDNCLAAFGKYAQEAQKTCGLLSELGKDPAPMERLLAILAQTQAEDQAHEAYLLLRRRLFEFLGDIDVS
ncbi:MAG TPA: hypothetical protein VFB23_10650 [Candidatus Acidoferrales bacterium]|nr:hypothetical protein [Candidatus Acidoferrales bacterium]